MPTLFGDTIVFWLFAACMTASIGAALILLERIRKQLNQALPAERQVGFASAAPRSMKKFWKTNILSYSLELIEQHRKYYPTSSIRKNLGIAVLSSIVSFIGFVLSAR